MPFKNREDRRAYMRAYSAAHGDRHRLPRARADTRTRDLARFYGITPQEYAGRLAAQGGVCAICEEPETRRHHKSGSTFSLAVDHNHETGTVRGLLCDHCNRAVGLMRDNPVLMFVAAGYLQKGSL